MGEATDSPVVFRLFTQGCHRNASVILLLQNMFPERKYNTDISRNSQYLALFRSPGDRKQMGIIAERMFDKNRVHFMNAYYKETEKPYGYLLVDNKPGTPPDNRILAALFGNAMLITSLETVLSLHVWKPSLWANIAQQPEPPLQGRTLRKPSPDRMS